MAQPLNGIRILDLSRLLPGAYASQMLADYGADVIKIEEPGSGDYGRFMPPQLAGGMSLYFVAINRNKRSMTLNLKSQAGHEIFLRLVRQSDVVLESFRPGVMDRLGLGYEQLKGVNPGLVYCAISGYGQDGPYRLRAGHDLNYAGYAGLLDYNRGPRGEPAMPPTQLGDLAGGSFMAVIGIMTALYGRTQTGEGRVIDVSMTEGVLSLLPLTATAYLNTGQAPQSGKTQLDGGLPCYNIYETQDGKHITLAALEYKFWHTFCTRIGHLELLPFHTPVGPCEADIDACVGPLNTIDEALNDPHAQTRGTSVTSAPIDETGTSFHTLPSFPRISDIENEQRYPPPQLGQHTTELLRDMGYDAAEIEKFKEEGVI